MTLRPAPGAPGRAVRAQDAPAQDRAATRTPYTPAGRPRDERVSAAITAAALRQLHEIGYANMSMESVASEAGVARATVYRRFHDKADLVTAAVGGLVAAGPPTGTDPLNDLAAFLDEFDGRFGETCLELIGCLLAGREEPGAMALHRRRVVHPRTDWARGLLLQARDEGRVRPDLDVDLTLQMLIGSVFARRVAGVPSEPGWARRAIAATCETATCETAACETAAGDAGRARG